MHSLKAACIASVVVLALITSTAAISSANTAPVVVSAIPDTLLAEDSSPIDNYRDLNDVFVDAENGTRLAFTIQGNSNPALINVAIDADSALDIGITPSMTGSAEIVIRATDSEVSFVEDTLVVTVASVYNVSGLVFEDADFDGTATDYDNGVADMALPYVDVELYDAGGAYIASMSSGSDGSFAFFELFDGTYMIRARSATIGDGNTLPMGGINSDVPGRFQYPLPEMTWGNSVPLYGGQDATVDDTHTANNAGPGDTYVAITVNGAAVTDVNFGFAYNLIVNTIDDTIERDERSQQGSLRQFIKNANGIRNVMATTANSSQFRIPTTDPGYNGTGNGEYTIKPLAELPTIVRVESADSVVFDATTQPGFSGTPIIELDGSLAGSGSEGLSISCGQTTIRGFVINRFDGHGIELTIQNANIIEGNYIGTDVTGTLDRGNGNAGVYVSSSGNRIGGTMLAAGNLISGNGTHGIEIRPDESGNVVQGNLIGTNASGTADLGNSSMGVRLYRATNNTIGGATEGARNVISGNLNGVDIIRGTGNIIAGNYIGPDASGSASIGNTFSGVWIRDDNGSGHTIGGTEVGAGNVISGNGANGIVLADSVTNIAIQGNYIGLDATGSTAMGNGSSGVLIESTASGITVGGTVEGARNVISGNPQQGVEVRGHDNLVQGNYIGIDATGMVAVGNGQVGVWFRMGATGNQVGGTTPGARNIISANGEDGVNFGETGTMNNVAIGNYIGTDATGTSGLGNVERGVRIAHQALNNTVGGTEPGSGNLIAFNGSDGVGLRDNAGIGNSILGNSFVANNGLSIDLGEDDVTPNDVGDTDTGANDEQNFPVLNTANATASDLTVSGSINTLADMTLRVELYSCAVADASGHGEGEEYLGFFDITTDTNGDAAMNETLPLAVAGGSFITATATNSDGSTSEFAANVRVDIVPTVVAAMPDTTVLENNGPINNYRDLNDVFTDFEDGNALTYVIEYNSDPSLVTATMDVDSALDLSIAADRTGSATIVIRATDAASLFVEDTLVVNVIPLPQITFATDPVGLVFDLDSIAYTAPQTFAMQPGSTHPVAVESPQQDGDMIFLFSSWSDGGAMAHDIVVPDTNATYTANFDTRFTYANIDSIVDVPDDQGGWVDMHFTRSGYDRADETVHPITLYELYGLVTDPDIIDDVLYKGLQIREEDGESNSAAAAARSQADTGESTLRFRYDDRDYNVRNEGSAESAAQSVWELLGNVGAEHHDHYVHTLPTESDYVVGMRYAVYYISARTADENTFFDSPVDSGYSVDNIAPAAPQGFALVRGTGDENLLSWKAPQDEQALAFRIYRSTDPDLRPSEENLVHESMDTQWVDAVGESWKYHYKITAVDDEGNESKASAPETVMAADALADPARFALYQNTPNPFNPTTVIRYEVPNAGGHVTLQIYDVAGRLIRTLVDQTQTSGQKNVTWQARDDRGNRVASGVYFYRLQAPGFTETRRMVLVQ